MTAPVGYLVSVAVVAVCAATALAAPRPRRTSRSHPSFWLTYLVNEQPFLAFYWLLASTVLAFVQGDLASPGGMAACAVAVLTAVGLAVLARRALRAGPVLHGALVDGLGPTAVRAARVLPLWRILFAPFLVRRRDVVRDADLRYGDAGKRNLLDVYHHRARPVGGPTLVYLHGGGFRTGHKKREGRALLHRLASQGWVCVSANYRLQPAAGFPDHLVNAKKAIAWARANASRYGGDPRTLFVAGSSAGGHLASMAGLTPNDPTFQPGFASADTSVVAVISCYGYYGRLGGPHDATSSPVDWLHRDAPAFLVVHGDRDSLTVVQDTRDFVSRLRAAGARAVAYAELPGAQHTFDLFHSLRYAQVVNAVEAFTTWVRASQPTAPDARPTQDRGGQRP
jgi:acetyl esterase/lipase